MNSKGNRSLCNSCPILAVTNCPILDMAYNKGLEGMSECEMKTAITKVLRVAESGKNLFDKRLSTVCA